MKKLLVVASLILPLAACTQTERGAAIGAASGGIIGGAISNDVRGAAVGAAVGGVAPEPLSVVRTSPAIASIATATAAAIPRAADTNGQPSRAPAGSARFVGGRLA
ncbi:hypothetical protein ACVMB3_002477 [Sinorhizobium meliloti]